MDEMIASLVTQVARLDERQKFQTARVDQLIDLLKYLVLGLFASVFALIWGKVTANKNGVE